MRSGRLADIAARDAVARACLRGGYSTAASQFGIDRKTAQLLWYEWAATREPDLPRTAPGFLGLHVISSAGRDCALVSNVDEMTIVELAGGGTRGALAACLDRLEDAFSVHQSAISLNTPYRNIVRERFPSATVMVCRKHAERAGEQAFLRSFKALTGTLDGRGRNVRECPHLFLKPTDDLADADIEEMSGWDPDVLILRDALEDFRTALGSGVRREALGKIDRVAGTCRRLPGARSAVSFLEQWREEIANSVLAHTDFFVRQMDSLQTLMAARRLPVELIRGLVVLRGEQKVALPGLTLHPGTTGGGTLGVEIGEAVRLLEMTR